eukprot:TRINITY_DN6062_c0_g2_i1.p1 TRINITY_DN6062_c0_g2~~TRINITY_DN6062_c0_g2_i1.p1  ORF type:complete len:422 (+),score=104.37 TRINITY_DN6062_c0_g2_i1:1348-2613(+)
MTTWEDDSSWNIGGDNGWTEDEQWNRHDDEYDDGHDNEQTWDGNDGNDDPAAEDNEVLTDGEGCSWWRDPETDWWWWQDDDSTWKDTARKFVPAEAHEHYVEVNDRRPSVEAKYWHGDAKESAAERRTRDRTSLLNAHGKQTEQLIASVSNEVAAARDMQTAIAEQVEQFNVLVHSGIASIATMQAMTSFDAAAQMHKLEAKLSAGIEAFNKLHGSMNHLERRITEISLKAAETKSMIPCRFYATGSCARADCPFSHDLAGKGKGKGYGSVSNGKVRGGGLSEPLFAGNVSNNGNEKTSTEPETLPSGRKADKCHDTAVFNSFEQVNEQTFGAALSKCQVLPPTATEVAKLWEACEVTSTGQITLETFLQSLNWLREAIAADRRIPPPAPLETPKKLLKGRVPGGLLDHGRLDPGADYDDT